MAKVKTEGVNANASTASGSKVVKGKGTDTKTSNKNSFGSWVTRYQVPDSFSSVCTKVSPASGNLRIRPEKLQNISIRLENLTAAQGLGSSLEDVIAATDELGTTVLGANVQAQSCVYVKLTQVTGGVHGRPVTKQCLIPAAAFQALLDDIYDYSKREFQAAAIGSGCTSQSHCQDGGAGTSGDDVAASSTDEE